MSNIDLKFDIKNMGKLFFIPIVILFICLLYFTYITNETIELKLAFPAMEFIIVPFSSWWIIYLYYDYYERNGLEVLLSYPISNAKHGLIRIMFFVMLYSAFSIPLLIYISLYSNSNLTLLSLQFIPQFIFFAGLSFCLITFFRNIGITMTIIAFYVATEFLTKGQLIPWYHIFFMNETPLNFYQLINKSIVNLIIGFLFINLGGYLLRSVKII